MHVKDEINNYNWQKPWLSKVYPFFFNIYKADGIEGIFGHLTLFFEDNSDDLTKLPIYEKIQKNIKPPYKGVTFRLTKNELDGCISATDPDQRSYDLQCLNAILTIISQQKPTDNNPLPEQILRHKFNHILDKPISYLLSDKQKEIINELKSIIIEYIFDLQVNIPEWKHTVLFMQLNILNNIESSILKKLQNGQSVKQTLSEIILASEATIEGAFEDNKLISTYKDYVGQLLGLTSNTNKNSQQRKEKYFDPATVFIVANYLRVENPEYDWDLSSVLNKAMETNITSNQQQLINVLNKFLSSPNNELVENLIANINNIDPANENLKLLAQSIRLKDDTKHAFRKNSSQLFNGKIAVLIAEYVNELIQNASTGAQFTTYIKPELYLDIEVLLTTSPFPKDPVLSAIMCFIEGNFDKNQLSEEINTILKQNPKLKSLQPIAEFISILADSSVNLTLDQQTVAHMLSSILPKGLDNVDIKSEEESPKKLIDNSPIFGEIPLNEGFGEDQLLQNLEMIAKSRKPDNNPSKKIIDAIPNFNLQELGLPQDNEFYLFLLSVSSQLLKAPDCLLNNFIGSDHFNDTNIKTLKASRKISIEVKNDRGRERANDRSLTAEISVKAPIIGQLVSGEEVYVGNLNLALKVSKTSPAGKPHYQLEVLPESHIGFSLKKQAAQDDVNLDILVKAIIAQARHKFVNQQELFSYEKQMLMIDKLTSQLEKCFELMRNPYYVHQTCSDDIQNLEKSTKDKNTYVETAEVLITTLSPLGKTPSQQLFLKTSDVCEFFRRYNHNSFIMLNTGPTSLSRWQKVKNWMHKHPVLTGMGAVLGSLLLASLILIFHPALLFLLSATAVLGFMAVSGLIVAAAISVVASLVVGASIGKAVDLKHESDFKSEINNINLDEIVALDKKDGVGREIEIVELPSSSDQFSKNSATTAPIETSKPDPSVSADKGHSSSAVRFPGIN